MIKIVSDRMLDKIKRAAEKATPGRWFHQEGSHQCDEPNEIYNDSIISVYQEDIDETIFTVGEHLESVDAEYLVLVQPEKILEMIEYIKGLEAKIEYYTPVHFD